MSHQRKIFFVTGCQRSGTTLLRLILNSHSQVVCFDESRSYQMLSSHAGWQHIGSILEKDIWCGFKIPRFAEQLASPALTDYGLVGECPNFYRRDPVLFVTRDVRDTICSMRALRHKDETWLNHWGIPIIKYWMERSSTFSDEFSDDFAFARHCERPDIAMGALYWKFKNAAFFKYRALDYPVLQIRYEDLVTNTREQVSGAVELLGLPWEDSLLQHHTQTHTETNTQGRAVGKTDTRKPISSSSLERFRSELDTRDLDLINRIAGDTAARLGYQW